MNEPLDVLLKNEGRETDQREGSGGRRIRARAERREDHPGDHQDEQNLRRVLEVGVKRIGRRRRQPVREPVSDQHACGGDR